MPKKKTDKFILPKEELHALLQTVPVDMAILDRDLRYVMASDRWLRNHHLPDADIIGKKHYSMFSDLPERWKLGHARCLQGATESCDLDRYERADGEVMWLRWTVRPWYTSEKEIGGIAIFTEILNERKKLEANLKKTKELYSVASTAGEVGVWDWEVSTDYLVWNEVMHELFDVPVATFKHSYDDFIKCIHKDDADRINDAVKQTILGVSPFDCTYRVIRRDGVIRHIRAKARVYNDKHGRLIRITGACYDITDQVETKNKLSAALAEQEQAQKQLMVHSKMLENAVEGIAHVDLHGMYIYVNETYAAMTGYTVSGLVGGSWQQTVFLDDVPMLEEAYARMKIQGKVTCDARGMRQDGTIFYKRVILIAQRNERNELSGHYCLMQDITEQKRADQRLEWLALYDSVTKLANRAHFLQKLDGIIEQLDSQPRAFAILFLDLNDFKKVNDSLGHHNGDLFLKRIARTIKQAIDPEHFLARLGGDEFVIIVDNLACAAQAREVAENITRAVNRPFYLNAREIITSVSIGITTCHAPPASADELLKQADMAMYHAKRNALGDNIQLYTSSIMERSRSKLLLEQQLRHAIENEELYLVYQPIIELHSQNLVGLEVLLRWKNPLLGEVDTHKFISVAEETGLIHSLGHWVIKNAISTYVSWLEKELLPVGGMKLSINCSPLQLNTSHILDVLEEYLSYYGLSGNELILEITENALMKNIDVAAKNLRSIVERGIEIAIDDFGQGYSSLSYLKQLPISYLKIDQAFLKDVPRDKDNCAIIKAIIDFSEALNLKVIAEGVETEGQRLFLLQQSCQCGQGNYISKPLRTEVIERFLSKEALSFS